MQQDFWQAEKYVEYLAARTRPAQDLLGAIPNIFSPETIYDLGCGPGNSTQLLHQRWPNAELTGIDNSRQMLDKACRLHPNLTFLLADIMQFNPSKPCDLIFSNAALQWLGDHDVIFKHLARQLNDKGMLVIQMPNNFHCPSHQHALAILRGNAAWQPLTKLLLFTELTLPYYSSEYYYQLFSDIGLHTIQCWQTTYYQEMPDHQAIADWMSGTTLRPILDAMSAHAKQSFMSLYLKALEQAYPSLSNNSVLFPYTRIFMTGRR